MSINVSTLGDIAGKFDISNSEAERIAGACETEEEFEAIWENEGWWADALDGCDDSETACKRAAIDGDANVLACRVISGLRESSSYEEKEIDGWIDVDQAISVYLTDDDINGWSVDMSAQTLADLCRRLESWWAVQLRLDANVSDA